MDFNDATQMTATTNTPVVVFDIGGTLIHPDFVMLQKWTVERTAEDVSIMMVERAFRLAVAGDVFVARSSEIEMQATRFFSSCGCPPGLSRHWIEWWMEVVNSGGVGSWLYRVLDSDAIATLLDLRRMGCRLIAASNSDGTLEAELGSFGLLGLFDEVYDSALLGVEKPSLAFYERVLHTSNSSAIMHVGDDLLKDVVATAAAGFSRVFLYDPSGIYDGVPPHVRIRYLSEIPTAIGIKK
jgi:FMN phosphatase YigB (HAD superfamily)